MSAIRCYCGEKFRPDGTCRHRCPPSANPKHLRAEAAKRRKATIESNRYYGTMVGYAETQAAAVRLIPSEARSQAKFTRRKKRSEKRRGSQCQGQK